MSTQTQDFYKFQFENMTFSKDGQLDELIALDRYVVPAFDGYEKGNTVVAIVDEKFQTKVVGTIISKPKVDKDSNDLYKIVDRIGHKHTVRKELLQKAIETEPHQLWSRWAKGAASVEKPELRNEIENEFRWFLDGYRYSPAGRIQLMLGQEYVTGQKANLTAYNCYVIRSPRAKDTALEQVLEVLDIAYIEASIMRRGGGVGINISDINAVQGSGGTKSDFNFYLDENHVDYEEILGRIKLKKFEGVTVITDKVQFELAKKHKDIRLITAGDSVDAMFKENLTEMIVSSYNKVPVVIDFNALRGRNTIVKNVGRSSGAVSWMELFALIARLIQQETINNVEFAEIFSDMVHLIIQGGSRRGALMLICNDDNENAEFFITRKTKSGFLSGANISLGVSDKFMNLVKEGKRLNKDMPLEKIEEKNESIFEAMKLWNLLIKSAHSSAEPGIVWLERYNKASNSWYFNIIVCTNPCGEQGLPEFGVCNLGHYVLTRFYEEGGKLDEVSDKSSKYFYPRNKELRPYDINWDDLARAVKASVRFQDNIIEYTPYHLKENEEVQKGERRVGIGSMALGTLLIQLKLRYGSPESIKFIDILYKFIAYHQYKTSIELAKEKGAFPHFDHEKDIQSGFMKVLFFEFPDLEKLQKKHGRRNVTLGTQAPTGSTSTYLDNIPMFRLLFGGTTGGIEPYFNWVYYRASRLGVDEQTVDFVKEYMEENSLTDYNDLPDYFVNAMLDLQPIDHVTVQAAVQKWTDSSISKTANCPKGYTVEETDELYLTSYDLGLKGMTIYVDGSREAQVLSSDKEGAVLESHLDARRLEAMENFVAESENEPKFLSDKKQYISKVPDLLYGFRRKERYQSGDTYGKAYIMIFTDEDKIPMEVWIYVNKDADRDMADALGRMTTQFIRFGSTSDNIEQSIKHLQKGKPMFSLPSVVGRVLSDFYYGKMEKPVDLPETIVPTVKPKKAIKLAKCASCGANAYDKGNCICNACGVSKCN